MLTDIPGHPLHMHGDAAGARLSQFWIHRHLSQVPAGALQPMTHGSLAWGQSDKRNAAHQQHSPQDLLGGPTALQSLAIAGLAVQKKLTKS